MPRMHGEREEIYQARRRFAAESAVATHAKLLEWEVLKANGIPIAAVEVSVPCCCSQRPFSHFHHESERLRFQRRMPPGQEGDMS